MDTQELQPGDLCQNKNGEFCLCLGSSISFQENYLYKKSGEQVLIIVSKFLSEKTLNRIHWMVYTYYSTYHNTIECFLGNNIEQLLKHRISTKKSSQYQTYNFKDNILSPNTTSHKGQQLIVFPDLWTLHQYTSLLKTSSHICISSGNTTHVQKAKIFRGIKQGHIDTLCCTHSQLFQDWNNLTHIVLFHPYKRYYKNQQDPRYSTKEVLENLAKSSNITIIYQQ